MARATRVKRPSGVSASSPCSFLIRYLFLRTSSPFSSSIGRHSSKAIFYSTNFLSIVHALLRFYFLPVRMLYLFHLSDGVCPVHDFRMGIAPCQYQVQEGRFAVYQFEHLWKIQKPKAQGIVDLIEDNEIELTGYELLPGKTYCFLSICPVFLKRIGIALDAAKPFSHHVKFNVRRKPLESVYFTCVHITFHELYDADFEAVPHGPKCHAHSRGCLPFSIAGEDNDETYLLLRFQMLKLEFIHNFLLGRD